MALLCILLSMLTISWWYNRTKRCMGWKRPGPMTSSIAQGYRDPQPALETQAGSSGNLLTAPAAVLKEGHGAPSHVRRQFQCLAPRPSRLLPAIVISPQRAPVQGNLATETLVQKLPVTIRVQQGAAGLIGVPRFETVVVCVIGLSLTSTQHGSWCSQQIPAASGHALSVVLTHVTSDMWTLGGAAWLEERIEGEYKRQPGYQEGQSSLFTLDPGAPEDLPDNLRGERWGFVQLPLSDLQSELDLLQRVCSWTVRPTTGRSTMSPGCHAVCIWMTCWTCCGDRAP